MSVSFEDIQSAATRIKDAVIQSPCPRSIPISEATGMEVFCKLDYLQRTGSFKERGARNALALLETHERTRGVIAASAGNHALGLSYHSKLLGIPCTVVMPRFAPLSKVSNCRKFGAQVILEGNNIAESRALADRLVAEKGFTYINGYDAPNIIAGQGTMGLEMAAQVPEFDAVVVPIGGGGLIAGIALALKRVRPDVKIIGVEPARCPSFTMALAHGQPTTVETQATLADGLAVPKVGERAFVLAHQLVDRVVLVSEHDLALAILRLIELEKAVVEGAGAAPLAACLAGLLPELKGKKVILPLCGGNIDTNILGRVLERGLAHDGRLSRFSATISDRPGGLARFTSIIAEQGASVIDITHDRAFASDDIATVTVHCIVETRDVGHALALRNRLMEDGFQISTGI